MASAATVGAGLAVAAGVAFGIYRMGQARSKASQQMMARAGGRSSAGFDLSMSEEQLQNALKDLTPFQKSVTMEGATYYVDVTVCNAASPDISFEGACAK